MEFPSLNDARGSRDRCCFHTIATSLGDVKFDVLFAFHSNQRVGQSHGAHDASGNGCETRVQTTQHPTKRHKMPPNGKTP